MRILIDTLIVLMLVCIIAAAAWYYLLQRSEKQQHEMVRHALVQLYEVALKHARIPDNNDGELDYPPTISPNWFKGDLPVNVLADSGHPWLDVAPQQDMSAHPPDPVLVNSTQAGFWYNPSTKAFRARAPQQASDKSTLRLYNALNATVLKALPRQTSIDPVRRSRSLLSSSDDLQATVTPDNEYGNARRRRSLVDAPGRQ